MQITTAIIERFLANRCTAEQALFVSGYLDQNPDVLEAYLQKSWEESESGDALPEGYCQEMLDAIRAGAFVKRPAVIRNYSRWIGIAALFILAAGVWWWLGGQAGVASAGNKPMAENKTLQTAPVWTVRQNTTGKALQIALQDGSVLTLSAGATVRYSEPFVKEKRDICLDGEAFFDVAKDKTRPFTVYAGSFSTTALGTSFLVTAGAASYRVKLYTGKVVIKAQGQQPDGWKGDVFLLPGQQMNYEPGKAAPEVTQFRTDDREKKVENVLQAETDNNGELVFDRTSLKEVLEKLGRKYDRPIGYDPSEIDDMYFSGTVLKDDSLSVILNVIVQMNGLTVQPKANGFLIKKSQ